MSLLRGSAGEMLEKGGADLGNGSIAGKLGTQVPFSYRGEGIAYTLNTGSCWAEMRKQAEEAEPLEVRGRLGLGPVPFSVLGEY